MGVAAAVSAVAAALAAAATLGVAEALKIVAVEALGT